MPATIFQGLNIGKRALQTETVISHLRIGKRVCLACVNAKVADQEFQRLLGTLSESNLEVEQTLPENRQVLTRSPSGRRGTLMITCPKRAPG